MNRRDRRAGGDVQETIALLNKARELQAQGGYEEAENICRELIKKQPRNTAALITLGLALHQRGKTDEPLGIYRKVVQQEPDNCFALMALAGLLLDRGERSEALSFAARARESRPPPQILNRLGVFYNEAGLRDKAQECLQAAITADPAYVTPYFMLQGLQKGTVDPARLLKISENAGKLPFEQRVQLEFALARAFLDAGDDDRAFRHYAAGNRLKKDLYSHNIVDVERYLDSITHVFSTAHATRLRGKSSVKSDRPVFITGMPRSGSTLVDQIIASHPEAASMGETPVFESCLPLFPDLSLPEDGKNSIPMISPRLMEALTPATLDAIAAKYLEKTDAAARGARRLVDKMLFNYQWAGIIRLALPGAKIVHCTRDPRDMGLSTWQTNFSHGIVKWAYDLEDIGRYYRAYKKVMAHWDGLFPGEVFEANYEKLVANPEPEIRKLLEFCGLPWSDKCLKFHETERVVKTVSADQVRRPLYGHSVGKWKKYENYLSPLLQTLENP